MPSNDDYLQELDRASQVLESLVGEDVDAIDIKSVVAEDAPFLAKIVSKLSPMVGNLMEQRIVQILDKDASEGYSWERQDPGFPDAILRHVQDPDTGTGYEIKAWYVLSTEITGRFKESQNLLANKNINVVIVAWCMSHMVFGKPKILGVLTVSGKELAASRDNHYHHPPEYLIVEPQDTTHRTLNYQQSNVNGYKLQERDSDADLLKQARWKAVMGGFNGDGPSTPSAQAAALELMNSLVYRLDTNFAKIDRVDNPDIESFKKKIMGSKYIGATIAAWKTIFLDLNSIDKVKQARSEKIIRGIYGPMMLSEPEIEVIAESPGAL